MKIYKCIFNYHETRGDLPTKVIAAPGGGGGGVTHIFLFFYIYVGSDHLLGFKILSFNIFFGFQKNEHFWGYEKFWDIVLGSSQNWTGFRSTFYAF